MANSVGPQTSRANTETQGLGGIPDVLLQKIINCFADDTQPATLSTYAGVLMTNKQFNKNTLPQEITLSGRPLLTNLTLPIEDRVSLPLPPIMKDVVKLSVVLSGLEYDDANDKLLAVPVDTLNKLHQLSLTITGVVPKIDDATAAKITDIKYTLNEAMTPKIFSPEYEDGWEEGFYFSPSFRRLKSFQVWDLLEYHITDNEYQRVLTDNLGTLTTVVIRMECAASDDPHPEETYDRYCPNILGVLATANQLKLLELDRIICFKNDPGCSATNSLVKILENNKQLRELRLDHNFVHGFSFQDATEQMFQIFSKILEYPIKTLVFTPLCITNFEGNFDLQSELELDYQSNYVGKFCTILESNQHLTEVTFNMYPSRFSSLSEEEKRFQIQGHDLLSIFYVLVGHSTLTHIKLVCNLETSHEEELEKSLSKLHIIAKKLDPKFNKRLELVSYGQMFRRDWEGSATNATNWGV